MTDYPPPPPVPTKGRGALTNERSRFESWRREPEPDLQTAQDEECISPAARTTVWLKDARSIISTNDSPDIPFDASINPYQGCEHGCVYCYARPTHAYLGLSPGLDFETKVLAKANAAALLEKALSARGYKPQPVVLGGNTDPYQPAERQQRITRGVLQVLERYRHPVSITTKSGLVLRDADILGRMAAQGLATVYISITSLRNEVMRTLEPRASAPARRLAAIRGLRAAGVPVGVLVAPVIPAITDTELEAILEQAAAAGADSAAWILLRLPREVAGLFEDWLQAHYPLRARHVLTLLSQMRGGKLYDAGYGTRMRGTGVFADLLQQRFALACRRYGLNRERRLLRTDLFAVPQPDPPQLALF